MVIDSHALLWWLEGSEALSKRAARSLRACEKPGGILVISSVSFWELRMKARRGVIAPKTPVAEWPALLGRLAMVEIADVSSAVWLRAADLPWKHRDPADRIIAATALLRKMPVLTRDRRFHTDGAPVRAIW